MVQVKFVPTESQAECALLVPETAWCTKLAESLARDVAGPGLASGRLGRHRYGLQVCMHVKTTSF